MDIIWLAVITGFAALVQSATGFGFGLIAVSTFLVILNSVAAIQAVIIITLVISCLHWPSLRKFMPDDTLQWLLIGCVVGFPVGIYVLAHLDIEMLKAIIAIVIIIISLQNAWGLIPISRKTQIKPDKPRNKATMLGTGFTAGVMASSMAMPGPVVMLYLSGTALEKNQIRATISSFFIFSYAGALIVQVAWVGIDWSTWKMSLILSVPALLGIALGHRLSNRINQQVFKAAVLLILIATGGFMLWSL